MKYVNKIIENILGTAISLAYIANVVYAFKFWGLGHGLLNFAFPYAIIADLLFKNRF